MMMILSTTKYSNVHVKVKYYQEEFLHLLNKVSYPSNGK